MANSDESKLIKFGLRSYVDFRLLNVDLRTRKS